MKTVRAKELHRRFLENTSGNIAMIAALSVIPIVSIAGLAVDFQLVITKKNTAQHTLDATLIAAARERQSGQSEDQIRAYVRDQYNSLLAANDPGLNCQDPVVTFIEGSEEINASVRCSQPTTLSAIFGREKMDFTVGSGTTYGIGKVDVAFVFDLSGSMNNGGRLSALKTAAKEAIDTLLPPDAAVTEDVRLSISTYNHSVNAGRFFRDVVDDNLRPSAIEASEFVGDRYESEYLGVVQIDRKNNRNFFDFEAVRCNNTGDSDCSSTEYVDWAARQYYDSTCVYNRTGSEAFTDAAPGTGSYIFAGHPIWDYRDNYDENREPADFVAKKDGQREILQRRQQYRSGQNGSNSGVITSNQSGTSQSRGAYIRAVELNESVNDNFAIEGCREDNAPVPLTNNPSTLKNFVDNMEAGGGTAGHLGIAWGWYLLSPEWSSVWPTASRPLEYDEEDSAKALIIMTDGAFNATFPRSDKAGSVPHDDDTSTEMAARYCDNIKADTNITIFTVGFSVPNNVPNVEGTGQTIMEYCATSPEFAFDADNAQELSDAYNQIAAEISDLRITN